MTKQTTRVIVVASIYCLTFVGVLVYAYTSVLAQSNEVNNLYTTMAEQNAKETAARSVADIIESTVDDRNQLATYFVTEKDTISFITEIELLANNLGIELETTSLEIIPAKDNMSPKLKTSFAFSGTASSLDQFIKAMESLPYHSEIPDLNIVMNKNKWSANINLFVTMTP